MSDRILSLQACSSPMQERNRLEDVWKSFIADKNFQPDHPGIRPLLLQSWQRCLGQGVDPVKTKAPIISSNPLEDDEFHGRLFPHLEPFLRKFREMAIETGHLFVFCNSRGEIKHIEGAFSIQSKAEAMNFVVGSSWRENNAGTNAIGTALASGSPIQIFAAEHFCQEVHEWTCSAAPIRDPATQKILGVIDLTGLWENVNSHSLFVVLTVAQAIEESLRRELEVERYKVLVHYLEASLRTPNLPLVALDRGGAVLKADSLLYEHRLIDENNKLKDCPIHDLHGKSEVSWEADSGKGRWKFVLIPYAEQGRMIGAVVHAMPPRIEIHKTSSAIIKHSFSSMIGKSPKFTSSIKEALSAAGTDFPVLIQGESGTGKELFAQSIHRASKRVNGPFVAVNCGALPKELGVSELFGFEGGSFTGAAKDGRSGKFQQAQGGTIFLDEIGEMPLDLQTILLRVLEEGEVVPLGAQKPIRLNVRVIAATNRDLMNSVEHGKFRRDLYYRLNILSIHVPPLRERPEDIVLLMDYHLQKACKEVGRSPLRMDRSIVSELEGYNWPGNVRELRNIAYRLAANLSGDVIHKKDLPNEINRTLQQMAPARESRSVKKLQLPGSAMPTTLKGQELETILSALDEFNGNVSEAARCLGIHRSTIYRKLRELPVYEKTKS